MAGTFAKKMNNLPPIYHDEEEHGKTHYLIAIFRNRKLSSGQLQKESGRITKSIDDCAFSSLDIHEDESTMSSIERNMHEYSLYMKRDLSQIEINKIHREFGNCDCIYIGKDIRTDAEARRGEYPNWQKQYYYVRHGLTKAQREEIEQWIQLMKERKAQKNQE